MQLEYKVIHPKLNVMTNKGLQRVPQGAILRLSDKAAKQLLARGKITPYDANSQVVIEEPKQPAAAKK